MGWFFIITSVAIDFGCLDLEGCVARTNKKDAHQRNPENYLLIVKTHCWQRTFRVPKWQSP
jgi:hypothetical protein